jgi:sensor domain CHASE-containing protein
MAGRSTKTAVDFSRRISVGLLASVALLSMTVAAVVLWMAMRQNEVAAETTFRMVKGGIAARLDRLATTTLEYSLWDSAYDAVLSGDEEWMYDNIGTVAINDGPMDMVILIRPDDGGRFAWDKESDEIARTGLVDEAAIRSVLGLLDDTPPNGVIGLA